MTLAQLSRTHGTPDLPKRRPLPPNGFRYGALWYLLELGAKAEAQKADVGPVFFADVPVDSWDSVGLREFMESAPPHGHKIKTPGERHISQP